MLIEVTDQGEGISDDDQERIFHEFVQLGKTQLQDGTGLGLPISRRLAELLRGSLTVESAAGKGSTFRLRLPQSAETRGLRLVEQEMPRGSGEESDVPPPAEEPSQVRRAIAAGDSIRS